jgi:outer membrane biosynthesis protein TonB
MNSMSLTYYERNKERLKTKQREYQRLHNQQRSDVLKENYQSYQSIYYQLNKERIYAKKPKKEKKMKLDPKPKPKPEPKPEPIPDPTPAPPPSPKKTKGRKLKKEPPRYQYEKGIFELSFE